MNRPFNIFLIFLTFNLTLTLTQTVAAKTFQINNQHSFVNFDIDYMKVSLVKGSFDEFKGAFEWDYQKGKLTELHFQIIASSINTRDKKRDAHLKRKDFFNVSKFPLIEFIGDEVIYKAGQPVKVKGRLRLKDKEKSASFDLRWMGFHKDAVDKDKQSLFLRANTVLKRKDFGLNWNKALDQGGWVVGDDVRIEVIVEANPTDSRPAFSRFFLKKNPKVKEGALSMDSLAESRDSSLDSEKQKKKLKN